MNAKSCRVMIQSKHSSLTRSEKAVANFVLENISDVLSCTVTELADKVGTSEASVVRFCKSVGFKGYQDFKISAAMDILPPGRHLNPSLDPTDDAETVCQKVFSSEVDVLNETLLMLDTKALSEAARKMREAERIAFFGSGGSLMVAMDAQHKLLKIGRQVLLHSDADSQTMCASLLKKGDIAFGISHSGSNQRVIHCLKLASEQKATTIGMTTQGRSPLNKVSDIMLYTSTKETVFKSESVSARIAQLAVIDSLVALIAFSDYKRSYEAIQKTRNATVGGKY